MSRPWLSETLDVTDVADALLDLLRADRACGRRPAAAAVQTGASSALDEGLAALRAIGWPHAGGVTPTQACALLQQGRAALVDLGSAGARKPAGQVPGSLPLAWATGKALTHEPRCSPVCRALMAR